MNNFRDAHILAYIRRDLPAEELLECDALMQTSLEFRERVIELSAIYNLSESLKKQKEIDTNRAWSQLSRKMFFSSFLGRVWNLTRTAAAILLPVFLLHQYVLSPVLKADANEMITMTSAPGVITKVLLPDGSEVWLNTQSELTYPVKFSGKERNVQLSGEAYFKVTADKKNRFNVTMPGEIVVSAYGTEFNVRAYHNDNDYQVTLAKGNVEIMPDNAIKKQAMAAGQKAVWSVGTREIVLADADTYVETAWKDGKMVFRREKLETISQKLARKFGVIIRLEGETLKDYEYTATFTDEALEDILELLKRSAPISYSISRQERLHNDTFTQRIVTIQAVE